MKKKMLFTALSFMVMVCVFALTDQQNIVDAYTKTQKVIKHKTTYDRSVSKKVLSGKIIVLDPGHGHHRPGAIGNGIVEKNETLDIAKRVKSKLEALGAKVYLTRSGDTDCLNGAPLEKDLACRPHVATVHHANLFLSIHVNSGEKDVTGAETYYDKPNSVTLAKTIEKYYIASTGLKNRSYEKDDLAVLRNGTVPGVLLEVGFLTNKTEAVKLKSSSFKNKMANGITNGIVHYLQ